MSLTAFTVVSEFRFDVAKAIIGTERLQGAVDDLSNSAQQAVDSISQMGASFVASISGAGGGVLGMIYSAIKSTDKFKATQIELANIMTANGMTLDGQAMGFHDALKASEPILASLVKKAGEMGLSPDAFAQQFKMYNAFLAPKGLSGENLEQSMELARVSMKAAPALGVTSEQSQLGIMSGISGQLSKDTHFGSRLFMEAGDAISTATSGAIKDIKSFNAAKPDQRIKALIAGLDKLAGSTDVVAARTNLLSTRIDAIKNLFSGLGNVLKPIGDVFLPIILKVLDMAIDWIGTKGRKTIKLLALYLEHLVDGPKEMMKQMMDLADAGNSLRRGVSWTALIVGFAALRLHIAEIAHLVAKVPVLGKFVGFLETLMISLEKVPILGNVMKSLTGMFAVGPITGFASVMKALAMSALRAAGLLGVLLIPIQGFAQAMNRAKLEWLEWIADNLPKITEVGLRLSNALRQIFIPFYDLVKGFEELFFLVIGGTDAMDAALKSAEALATIMEIIKFVVGGIWSSLRAIVAALTTFIVSLVDNIYGIIKNALTGNKLLEGISNPFEDAMQFGMDEGNKTWDRFMTPTMGEDGEAKQKVENHSHNYDVKMTNNFKEVLQPDRIAYTITEQLKKSSTFATQKSGGGGSLASKQSGAI